VRLKERYLYYPLGYKPALDGLRAFAILPVLLFHGDTPGFRWGYVGVDLFFVISGYLITSILLNEHARTGHISLMGFYRRRALRLLPALAALCLVFLLYSAVVLHNLTQGSREVFIVALYFGNWTRAFGTGLPQFLGHTWSLAIEEQYYMLWPTLLMVILALSSRVTSALCLIAAVVIAVISWRAVLTFHGATPDRLYNGTDTRADALLIGSALALALATPVLAVRLKSIAFYLWLPAALVIVAVPTLLPWDDKRMFLGGFSVVATAAATILTAAITNGPLARILSNSVFVWIGQRSYGLYLWHYPITLLGILQFHMLPGSRLSLIEVTGAFALATLSYRFIEHPFLERRYASSPVEHIKPTIDFSN
jgi:peptidoglycan/LPS O-acetylase OafA/YrhL